MKLVYIKCSWEIYQTGRVDTEAVGKIYRFGAIFLLILHRNIGVYMEIIATFVETDIET